MEDMFRLYYEAGFSAYIANPVSILLGFMAIDYQSSPFTTGSLYYQQVFSVNKGLRDLYLWVYFDFGSFQIHSISSLELFLRHLFSFLLCCTCLFPSLFNLNLNFCCFFVNQIILFDIGSLFCRNGIKISFNRVCVIICYKSVSSSVTK